MQTRSQTAERRAQLAYLAQCTTAEELRAEDIEHVEELDLLASLPLARPWIAGQIIEFSTHPWWLHGFTPGRGHDLIRQHELPVYPLDIIGEVFWDKESTETFYHLYHFVPYLSEPNEDTDPRVTAWVATELEHGREPHSCAGRFVLEYLLRECARKGYSFHVPDWTGRTALDYIDAFGSDTLREAFPPSCGLK